MIHPAAPAWTLKGKKSSIDKLNNGYTDSSPGPVYNLSQLGRKTRAFSYTTGKSQRCQINDGVLNNPSPSQYNPNNPNLLTHSVSFPKQQKLRQISQGIENPDPCSYKFDSNMLKSKHPNYTMGSKYPSIMDDTGNNPGPGFYNNPEFTLASTAMRNSKFGSQPRFSEPNLRCPGPGDYNISKGFQNGKGTLSKSRKFLQPKNGKPGPGQYNRYGQFDQNLKNNKGKTLGKRLDGAFNTGSETVESFNNYLRDDNKNTGRSFSVGKQPREVFKSQDNPGPTDYKPMTAYTINNSTSRKFPKSSFIDQNELIHNPGPGQYQTPEYKSVNYTIPKSKSMDNFNKNPGAGRYEAERGMGTTYYKYRNQQTGHMIGNSNRTNFISKNIAGVGDYNILMRKTGGVTIPRANRFPNNNKYPGPGDYNLHSTISNFGCYRKKI